MHEFWDTNEGFDVFNTLDVAHDEEFLKLIKHI